MSTANVLVVDDDISVCRMLELMLSGERYNVLTIHSVAGAIEAIAQKHFDLYIIDYTLPHGTGLDLAKEIRSKSKIVPIIMVSGYDYNGVALRAEKCEISEIIEKPFARSIICNAVDKAIERTQVMASALKR
jgi:two-component system response regulator HydG